MIITNKNSIFQAFKIFFKKFICSESGYVNGFSTNHFFALFFLNPSKRILECVSGGVPITSKSTKFSLGLNNKFIESSHYYILKDKFHFSFLIKPTHQYQQLYFEINIF